MIYIIQAGETDRIKIGWTAIDPARRLNSLQTGNSELLKILRVLDGGRDIEKWLHHRFRSQRLVREWFTFHPDMLTIDPHKFERKRRGPSTMERARMLCAECGPRALPSCACMPRRKGLTREKEDAFFRNQGPPTEAEYRVRCRETGCDDWLEYASEAA